MMLKHRQASINIADASMLAGWLQVQDIATAVQVINWGMPNGNANVIATIGDSDKAAITLEVVKE